MGVDGTGVRSTIGKNIKKTQKEKFSTEGGGADGVGFGCAEQASLALAYFVTGNVVGIDELAWHDRIGGAEPGSDRFDERQPASGAARLAYGCLLYTSPSPRDRG